MTRMIPYTSYVVVNRNGFVCSVPFAAKPLAKKYMLTLRAQGAPGRGLRVATVTIRENLPHGLRG